MVRILSGVYDARALAPENVHNNNVLATVDEEKLHKAEFLELWNRINHKSFYTVQFDTPELIDHSIRALDAKLNVTRVQINLEYGEQTARLESREQLEQGKGFQKNRSGRESAEYAPLGSVRYDLVGKLVEETGRPIRQIFQEEGEAAFRRMEKALCARVTQKGGPVIATGGGIVKDRENWYSLRQNGVVLWLDRPLDRLEVDPERPLSRSREALEAMREERLPLYEGRSDGRIDNTQDPDRAVRTATDFFIRLAGR